MGMTPYGYCAGNPIVFGDPDGKDTIKVSSEGCVSEIIKSDGENVFLDYTGCQLYFNDKDEADKNRLTKTVNEDSYDVNDRVYMNMSYSDALSEIKNVGKNMDIKAREGISRYWTIREASRGEADFAMSFLRFYYENNRNREFESSMTVYDKGTVRTDYQEDFIYFRFEGTNTLYNLFDSGNFMWGAWSKHVGITDFESEWGPELNELFRDSDADSRAIKNGRNWYK